MAPADWLELARRQLADYDARQPGRVFEKSSPITSAAEAYRLQLEVAALRIARGERLAGFKIGCVSEVVRRQLGMDQPLFGHVFASEIRTSQAALDPGSFSNLAIEGEFAVRMAAGVPDSNWLRTHPDEALAAVFPVIELHNYVLRGPQRAIELIAGNGMHAGFVAPSQQVETADLERLRDEPISVIRNGRCVGQATASAIPGGPFGTLCGLVDQLASYGIRLERDQIVLTGSPLPLYPVEPGDFIEVVSGTLGRVCVHIRACR